MKLKGWLSAGVLAGIISGGIAWARYSERNALSYQTTSIGRGNSDATVAATGTCNAVVTVQVGSQVSGNIKELYADFNTKVTKGQLVALIDPEMFQAQVDQARASLDSANEGVVNAQAAAAKAEADVATAVAGVASAKAQVAKAQSDLQNAAVQLDRSRSSFAKGVLDKQDLDTAQATNDADAALLRAAESQVNAAAAAVKSAEAAHQVALAQIEVSQGQARQAAAELDQAKLNLLHTKIFAPVDGVVIARYMDVGQTVAASFQVGVAFAFSALVGVFFGYYPARKAAYLNPIEALRYE